MLQERQLKNHHAVIISKYIFHGKYICERLVLIMFEMIILFTSLKKEININAYRKLAYKIIQDISEKLNTLLEKV